ncbi:MAG TPA: sugar-binding transcriptional regulator [Gammaproteobacteria bacterium]|nr:sugar-binding transcriptional regulator [Gammaproteobacteria bacterium]
MANDSLNSDRDLAVRAAWLSYVGGHTQAEIAQMLGLSRMKVHRLIATAIDEGVVKVFIEGEPAELIRLENFLSERFGLQTCTVVPSVPAGVENPFVNLGTAAARFLKTRLDSGDVKVLGLGWGRTLGEMVRRLPQTARPDLEAVAVLGSVTEEMALSPYDVVHRLVDATDARGYLLPLPLFADSAEDRETLLAQRRVRKVYDLACRADLVMVGIAALPPLGYSLLQELNQVSRGEYRTLHDSGAVAEVVAQFIDRRGEVIDCELNRRSLGVSLDVLRELPLVAVAGGEEKVPAILAALKSGMLNGLITDETVAWRLYEIIDN